LAAVEEVVPRLEDPEDVEEVEEVEDDVVLVVETPPM
jgi:hypothetical protein